MRRNLETSQGGKNTGRKTLIKYNRFFFPYLQPQKSPSKF